MPFVLTNQMHQCAHCSSLAPTLKTKFHFKYTYVPKSILNLCVILVFFSRDTEDIVRCMAGIFAPITRRALTNSRPIVIFFELIQDRSILECLEGALESLYWSETGYQG